MSGGYWNYTNDTFARELFGWSVDIDYGLADEDMKKQRKVARRLDPLEDKVISELVYDVFCLLHSFDWYKECDNCERHYREDVEFFKNKWLKKIPKDYVKQVVQEELEATKKELLKAFNVEEVKANDT